MAHYCCVLDVYGSRSFLDQMVNALFYCERGGGPQWFNVPFSFSSLRPQGCYGNGMDGASPGGCRPATL